MKMKEDIENQVLLLDERKRLFEEECEKFERYQQESHESTQRAEQETKKLISYKQVQ
jgi:hypothetical protein